MTSTVQAWIHTRPSYPSTLELSHTSVPVAPPNATSIIVQMHAVALNPVDIQKMNFPAFHLPGLSGAKVPCSDFSGTVLAAGSASGLGAGDSVFGLRLASDGRGTLAEAQVVDTAQEPVARVPAGWSHAQAAAMPLVFLTARTSIDAVAEWVEGSDSALSVPSTKANKLVVLGGSSATGMYTVHLAQQRGWEVLATCRDANAAFVRSMGAAQTVDYTADDVPAAVAAFGPAAIVDCVGGTACVALAPRYVSIVGDKTGRDSIGGPITYFWTPRQIVRWAYGRLGWGPLYDILILQPKREWLDEAARLDKDLVKVDSTFAFADARQAFERLNTGRARGKVVVTLDQSVE